MDARSWLDQLKEQTAKLYAATTFGGAAAAAFSLARHRAALLEIDWIAVSGASSDLLLKLTDQLPARERHERRVILAAALFAQGQISEGRKVVDAVFASSPWPEKAEELLAHPWAVILENDPDLLPAWGKSLNRSSSEKTFEWIGRELDDEKLLRMLRLTEASRLRGMSRILLRSMSEHKRLPALLRGAEMPIEDEPGEAWEIGHSAQEIKELLLDAICHLFMKDGRIDETLDFCRRHFPLPLKPFGGACRAVGNPEGLRMVLEAPPADCGGLDQWAMAAETLAETTSLAAVWPFFQKNRAEDWATPLFFFEKLVHRAVITRETELAEKFLSSAPEENARPLRARLALSAIRSASELASPGDRLLPNILRLKMLRKRKGGREKLARLALSDFLSGAERKGARLYNKLQEMDEEEEEEEEETERVPEDALLHLDVILLDLCGALKKLDALVFACVKGQEWGHPGSLLDLALVRLYEMEGLEPAISVFTKLPAEVREEAQWDVLAAISDDIALRCDDDGLKRLLESAPGSRSCRQEKAVALGTLDHQHRVAAAREALMLAVNQDRNPASHMRADLEDADASNQKNAKPQTKGDWRAPQASLHGVPDAESFKEISLEDLEKNIRAVPRSEAGGRPFFSKVWRWRRQSPPYAVRKMLDDEARGADSREPVPPPDYLKNPDDPLPGTLSSLSEKERAGLACAWLGAGRQDLLAGLLFGPSPTMDFTFRALEELAWRLPDEFYLDYRDLFARCAVYAQWMVAAAAVRGHLPEGPELVESARALDTDIMLFRPAGLGGCDGVDD